MKKRPVAMKAGAKVETVEEYLKRGGKITKCPDGKADNVWTSTTRITKSEGNMVAKEISEKSFVEERTKMVTEEL